MPIPPPLLRSVWSLTHRLLEAKLSPVHYSVRLSACVSLEWLLSPYQVETLGFLHSDNAAETRLSLEIVPRPNEDLSLFRLPVPARARGRFLPIADGRTRHWLVRDFLSPRVRGKCSAAALQSLLQRASSSSSFPSSSRYRERCLVGPSFPTLSK